MEKTKKKGIVTACIISVIVILIVIGVLLFLLTDLFKSNQERFFKYVAQNSEMLEKYMENPSEDPVSLIKNNPHSTKGTVSFDLVSSDPQIANQMIPARNFSIEYTVQADPQAKKDSSQATLKFLDKNLFEVKYAHNNDVYGITSSEVINKYLTFENNNLKELASKYGISDVTNIPNKIEVKDFSQLFTIQEEDAKHIVDTYMEVISQNIPKDKYYHNKNVMVQISADKQIQTNCYGVQIDKETFKKITVEILNKLQEDDQTLNLLLDKIALFDSQTQVTIPTLKEEIANLAKQVQESENAAQNFTIEVYEAQGKLVQTVIKTENEEVITITYETSGEHSVRAIVTYDYNYITSNAQATNGIVNNSFQLRRVETAKETEENRSNYVTILTFKGNDNKMYKVSIQSKIEQNIQNEQIIDQKTINISDSDTTYFTIKINSTTTASNDLQIEELTKENSASINNFSPAYTQNLLQGIINRLQKLYGQKIEMINNIQKESTTITTNPDNNLLDQTQNTTQNTIEDTIQETNNTVNNTVGNTQNIIPSTGNNTTQNMNYTQANPQ